MFRVILSVVVVSALAWIWITFRRKKTKTVQLWQRMRKGFPEFRESGPAQAGSVLDRFRKATYLLSLACFLILAVSAYLQVLISGSPLTGWLLIIHVTAAPLFALGLMATVLLWAHRQRFNQQDWLYLQQILRQKKILLMRSSDAGFWNKLSFWIFILSAVPAILSILLQLYPLFGSEGMEILLNIHRYSTLILFIVVVYHAYLLLQRLNN
jgi:cytochrome b subunit of formate dehydrogenase